MLFIQSLCYGSTSTTLKLEMEKIVIITATLTHQFIFFETILILEFLYKLSYNVPEDGSFFNPLPTGRKTPLVAPLASNPYNLFEIW